MAIATVEGTVSRINQNGVGFGVKESWTTREGRPAHRYWSVWMPDGVPVQVVVGDDVKITGPLRTSVARDPRFVDHTVSSATVDVVRENGDRSWGNAPADDAPPPDEYPPTDSWATASIPDADIPY